MSSAIQLNLVDRSSERTSVRIPTIPVSAANIATLIAFEESFIDLVSPLTLLNATGTSLNKVTPLSNVLPTDPNALREVAVRFIMQDSATNQASFSIGGPNLTEFPFTVGEGGDVYEWGSGTPSVALGDFVDDVLVIARHPISGLAMTMRRLELVGRSN